MPLFDDIRAIENQNKVRILTCEGEICTFLMERNIDGLTHFIARSKFSQVTIHKTLAELSQKGLIRKEVCKQDGRKVIYELDGFPDGFHSLLPKD